MRAKDQRAHIPARHLQGRFASFFRHLLNTLAWSVGLLVLTVLSFALLLLLFKPLWHLPGDEFRLRRKAAAPLPPPHSDSEYALMQQVVAHANRPTRGQPITFNHLAYNLNGPRDDLQLCRQLCDSPELVAKLLPLAQAALAGTNRADTVAFLQAIPATNPPR
jgi:hypothetical protein